MANPSKEQKKAAKELKKQEKAEEKARKQQEKKDQKAVKKEKTDSADEETDATESHQEEIGQNTKNVKNNDKSKSQNAGSSSDDSAKQARMKWLTSISKSAEAIFSNEQADTVSDEEMSKVVKFFVNQRVYGPLENITSHITSSKWSGVVADSSISSIRTMFTNNDMDGVGEMLRYHIIITPVLSTKKDEFCNIIREYLNISNDFEDFSERVKTVETITRWNYDRSTEVQQCINESALPVFKSHMMSQLEPAKRPDKLKSLVRTYKSSQSKMMKDEKTLNLIDETVRGKVVELFSERIEQESDINEIRRTVSEYNLRDVVDYDEKTLNLIDDTTRNKIVDLFSERMGQVKDIDEIQGVVFEYDLSDVVDYDEKTKERLDDIIYDKSLELALSDIEPVETFAQAKSVFNKYERSYYNVVTNDDSFVDSFKNKAKAVISGIGAVEELPTISECISFNTGINSDLQTYHHDITKELMMKYLGECTSVIGLNKAIDRLYGSGFQLSELNQKYTEMAIEILSKSADVQELSDNYNAIRWDFPNGARKTDEIAVVYAKRAVALLIEVDSRTIPELSLIAEGKENVNALARALLSDINKVRFNSLYAWKEYFVGQKQKGIEGEAITNIISEICYCLAIGLMESNPDEAILYLEAITNRDKTALTVIGHIARAALRIAEKQYDEAYSIADEAIQTSNKTAFSGKAVQCYIHAVKGEMKKEELESVLKSISSSKSEDKMIRSIAMKYATMSYLQTNQNDVYDLFIKTAKDNIGESKVMDCMYNIALAFHDYLETWLFAKAGQILNQAETLNVDGIFTDLIELGKSTLAWGTSNDRQLAALLKEMCEKMAAVCETKYEQYMAHRIKGNVLTSDGAYALEEYKAAMKYLSDPTDLIEECAFNSLRSARIDEAKGLLEGVNSELANLMKIRIKAVTVNPRVKSDLDSTNPSDDFSKAYKCFVFGVSYDRTEVWNKSTEAYADGLRVANNTGHDRMSVLLRVDLHRARAKALHSQDATKMGEINGEFEDAISLLDKYSGNMVDLHQLMSLIVSEKSALKNIGSGPVTGGAKEIAKSRIIDFDGTPITIQSPAIGEGGTYKVYYAHDNNQAPFAVRIHAKINPFESKTSNLSDRDTKAMERDVEMWQEATNIAPDNIVRLISSVPKNTNYPAALSEYGSRTLSSCITVLSKSEKEAAALALLEAIAALHRGEIVHNDIKPDNLLEVSGKWKLSDFDISFFEGDEIETSKGTREYMSPEHFSHGKIGMASDIWAAGVTLYCLSNPYRNPFDGEGLEYEDNVKNGRFRADTVSPRVADFLSKIFRVDPLERPNADQLLEDFKTLLTTGGI